MHADSIKRTKIPFSSPTRRKTPLTPSWCRASCNFNIASDYKTENILLSRFVDDIIMLRTAFVCDQMGTLTYIRLSRNGHSKY